MAGVPMLLPGLRVGTFDVLREAGVSERLDSTLRFLDGGAFLDVVAIPFLVFEGAGRFREGAESGAGISVDCIGTEDSRNGDCVLTLCSCLRAATALGV